MLVQDIMKTDIVLLYAEATFLDAAKLFLLHHISAAPVVTPDNTLIGVISEKDLFHALYPTYHDLYAEPEYEGRTKDIPFDEMTEEAKNKKIIDIMSRRLISTTPDTNVLKIGGLMVATGIHHVPVVDHDRIVVGMVSRGDIYRAILEEKFQIQTMNPYSHSI